LLRRDSRFVLDNDLMIAAIKSGWKKSTDLLFTILLSDAAIYVNKELLFSTRSISTKSSACLIYFSSSKDAQLSSIHQWILYLPADDSFQKASLQMPFMLLRVLK
jgi:hypothetical protein